MLVFNGYLGSYAQRQLEADHINYNKYILITLNYISAITLKKNRKNLVE